MVFILAFLAAVVVLAVLFAWARRAIRARVSTMAMQGGHPSGQQVQRMDPSNEILAGTIANIENAGFYENGLRANFNPS